LGNMFWGRGTQRQEEQRNRRKEREASSREEETLRNDQRQAKDSIGERNHNNIIESNTNKRAAVYSDANHPERGSKKPRRETTKREEAGVNNPRGVAVAQKASSRIRKIKEEIRELEEIEHQSPEAISPVSVVSSDSPIAGVGLRRVSRATRSKSRRKQDNAGWNLQYRKLHAYYVKHGHCEWFLAVDHYAFILNTPLTPHLSLSLPCRQCAISKQA
jgi:hypothetical protein